MRAKRQFNCSSLSLNVYFYFVEMPNYFSIKTKKRKVGKCLKCVKEDSRRFELINGKYLSIFLGIFVKIVEVTHFSLDISVPEVN